MLIAPKFVIELPDLNPEFGCVVAREVIVAPTSFEIVNELLGFPMIIYDCP